MVRALLLTTLALPVAACAPIDETFRPVTVQGRAIESFFGIALIASAVVLVLVVGGLIYVLITFRGPGEASTVTGNQRLEVGWTAAALALVFGLFALAVRTMGAVDASAAPGSGPTTVVQVIGHQWWWEFRYPDSGAVTANELYVPEGQPVELRITGADVIHSFWVPRLGWKRDAIPNKTNTMQVRLDSGGTFDGPCAEYCGAQHAWMRIRLTGVPPQQFDAWARAQAANAAAPADAAAQRGLALFLSNTCVSCHAIRGTPANATVGPDLTHVGSRTTLGAGVLDNSPDAMRRWIADPQAIKPGARMPGFPNLSSAQVADLAAYLESLK
jgi:cytochrome c oxidase subunit 2